MSEEKSNNDSQQPSNMDKLRKGWQRGIKIAGETAVSTTQKTAQLGSQMKQNAETAVGHIQRRLGEDYYAILSQNPLVLDTLSREKLLQNNEALLNTAYNIPWKTSVFWGVNVGAAQVLQQDIAKTAGQVFHYGPGHIPRWEAVNRYMDSVRGSGHRLKFGHSIDHLPDIRQIWHGRCACLYHASAARFHY